MNQDPSLPPEPLSLTSASIQEIQLELIRRRRFNAFDGPKIVASLRQHRSLWRAVLMDRLAYVAEAGTVHGLIKLRDLPANHWNVDDLYILTDTTKQAFELQRIADDEQWNADNTDVFSNPTHLLRLLGSNEPACVVSFWWD